MKVCTWCKELKDSSMFFNYKSRSDGLSSNCRECKKKRYWANREIMLVKNKENYHKHREARLESNKRYRQSETGRLKTNENGRNYLKNPQRKMAAKLRSSLWETLHETKNPKFTSALNLLGCTIPEFLKHLESQFVDGMTWENYGKRGWHIDHVIPCCSFDMSKLEEQRKCFHFSNLRPLWGPDNCSKAAKDKKLKFIKLPPETPVPAEISTL